MPKDPAACVAAFPDIGRVDVDVAVVSQRETSDPSAQHALVRATVAAWDAAPWPEDLISRTHDTARAWIDTVFAALESEPALHPGGIAGHFHVSLDGTRVMNYAEWVDEASHRDAIGQAGSIGRGPAWQRVHSHPGVSSLGFRRYVPTDARQRSVMPSSDV